VTKDLKHTVGVDSVLDFEILRFAQDNIQRRNVSPSNIDLALKGVYGFDRRINAALATKARGLTEN